MQLGVGLLEKGGPELFLGVGLHEDKLPVPDIVEHHYNLCKGAGSFHIHRKTMKEFCTLAALGVREQPNLAQNLVTHRH